MNAGMRERPERGERIISGLLAVALLAGVAWALAGHGGMPALDLHGLHGWWR